MIPRHRYKYLISYSFETKNNIVGQGSSVGGKNGI